MPQMRQAGRSAKVGSWRSIFGERLPGFILRARGNVPDEAIHGLAVSPGIVRRKVPGCDGRIELRASGECHRQRRAAEQIRALYRELAEQRRATNADSPGDVSRRKSARVEQDDSVKPLRHLQHRAEPDRAAPILGDERNSPQVELLDQRSQVRDVVVQRQQSLRLFAQATPNVINRNAAVLAAERRDQPSPVERPSRVTVDEEQRFR